MFDGAVLLATKGKVGFKKAYGLANRDWGIPNTTDTRFSIASLGKAMTAHLILTLVEDGSLSLESPIATYLPTFNKRIADRVTNICERIVYLVDGKIHEMNVSKY